MAQRKHPLPSEFLPLPHAPMAFWSVLFPEEADGEQGLLTRIKRRIGHYGMGGGVPWESGMFSVAIKQSTAVLVVGDVPPFEARLFPPLQRGYFELSWEMNPPLSGMVQGLAPKAFWVEGVARVLQAAVGDVCDEVSAALQAALVDGKLEAEGVVSTDRLNGRVALPSHLFQTPELHLHIVAGEIWPGAAKIDQVVVRRSATALLSDAELVENFRQRISAGEKLTQERAEQIARERGAVQKRPCIRDLLKQAGGATSPGPTGPRKNRAKTRVDTA